MYMRNVSMMCWAKLWCFCLRPIRISLRRSLGQICLALLRLVNSEKAIGNGITNVVFDRGSRKYHGDVKAFADAIRAVRLLF